MSTSFVQVSANGLARFGTFTQLLRDEEDSLAQVGIEYEELDRRGDPATGLVVTMVVSMLTAAACKIVEHLVATLFEEEAKQPNPTVIVVLNGQQFALVSERDAIVAAIRQSQARDGSTAP
jgi:hypothetical protein